MRTLLIIAGVFLLVVLVLVFPLRARFAGHINVLNNICIYSLKVLFIRLLVGRARVKFPRGIVTENVTDNLPKDEKHPHLMDMWTNQILKKLTINKADLFFNFGASTSAQTTALVCGTVQSISAVVAGLVLNRNPNADVFEHIKPEFEGDECTLTIQLSVSVSILSLILAFLMAKKEYKLWVKDILG